MSLKLVVPAKRSAGSRNTERRSTCRDINHPRSYRRAGLRGRQGTIARRRNLPLGWPLVQHIRQGFRVHEPMLYSHVQDDFARILPAARRPLRTEDPVKFLADAEVIGIDLREARPVGGLVRRKAAAHRIDAECKEAIELLVSGSEAQRLACYKIPVECLEVAEVEDNSVPFSNRPVIQRFPGDDSKQVIGHRPRFRQADQKLLPILLLGCRRIQIAISPFRLRGCCAPRWRPGASPGLGGYENGSIVTLSM